MAISKGLLRELLDYSYSFSILKQSIKDDFDDSFKGKSKQDCVEYIVDKRTRDEAVQLVSKNLHCPHQVFHVYETDEAEAFTDAKIQSGIRAIQVKKYIDDSVVHLEKVPNDPLSIQGLLEISYIAQPINEKTDAFEGVKEEYNFLLPFRVTFQAPRHVKVRFLKFSPSRNHRLSTGKLVFIREVNFNPDVKVASLLKGVCAGIIKSQFSRSNLTTGVKELVRQKRIGAIYAAAEDSDGEGIDHRTKNNTQSGCLIEHAWLHKHLLPSTKIQKTRWFWIDGITNLDEPSTLEFVTIDCDGGTCTKDRSDEKDYGWFVDEIIDAND